MRISVLGASGAVGSLVVEEAKSQGCTVVCSVSDGENIGDLFNASDVIVDFSASSAVTELLRIAAEIGAVVPLVIGTTGLSQEHFDRMLELSSSFPILYSPNMSYTMSVVNLVVRVISGLLDDDFDVEILDVHHRYKKDSPSGTSLMLGKTVAEARRRNPRCKSIDSEIQGDHQLRKEKSPSEILLIPARRDANTHGIADFAMHKERMAGEIGFSSQRCGNVTGIHEVSFSGNLERVKVVHEASSKRVFARGAIAAAHWIVDKCPGFYTMDDMLRDDFRISLGHLYND
jgi:4-hydroxy-tetrahydrodipicolinate reductase